MKNILLIKGKGVYRAIGNYVDEFAKGFRKLGYNTITLDIEKLGYREKLEWILKEYPIYAAIDCQGAQVKFGLSALYEEDITLMTYLCDHPLHHHRILKMAEPNWLLINLDQNHTRYIKEHYPKVQHAGFVPLSGNGTDVFVPYGERKTDVIFTGTYWEPKEIILSPEDENNFVAKLRYEVQCHLIRSPWLTIEEVVQCELSKYHLQVGKEEFADIMAELADVESNIRAYFRDKIIRILLKAGISLTVFGEGWEKLSCEGVENLKIMNGDAKVARRALGDAKIVLNIMPWFKAGFQERIAAGMLSGAVVFTDTSQYLEREFCHGTDIMLYRLEELEDLPLQIKEILSTPETAAKIAENGQKKAQEYHTWQNRIRQMAELLESVKGRSYEESKEPGKELPIEWKGCRSYAMQDFGMELSGELDHFYGLSQSPYVTKEDAYKFMEKVIHINSELKKRCQYEFETESNLKAIYEQTKEMTEYTMLTMLVNGMLVQVKEKIRSVELEELYFEDAKYWNKQLYDELLIKVLDAKYQNSNQDRLQEWLESVRVTGTVRSYPIQLINAYEAFIPKIDYDEQQDMIFVWHNGKKMYYPREYSVKQVYIAYRFCCMEQDVNSTHRYLDDEFMVEENSVVIDAGTAEGNFALDIVDIARKIYLVECDTKWLEALTYTFEPYKDKVTIIPKMLGNTEDDETTTIDAILAGEEVHFIKMDVEGAEADALSGARQALEQNKNLKCVIATYHKKGMEERVKKYLEQMQFEVSNTEGYLFYKDYSVPVWDNELRHGLVRAEKKFNS